MEHIASGGMNDLATFFLINKKKLNMNWYHYRNNASDQDVMLLMCMLKKVHFYSH